MTEELVHVRCITCNKIIAHQWIAYRRLLEEGKSIKQALDAVGLRRPCCRMRMMNPFKVTQRSSRQTDPSSPVRSLESSYAQLSIASSDEASNKGALSAIKRVKNLTVVPEEKMDISLPGLPSLPALPQMETPGNISKDVSKISRSYQAW